MKRECGLCTLCCKLLPVKELNKKANTKCDHQRSYKGCLIYPRRPLSCMVWNCRWLVDPNTTALSRPDRSHYVIDIMPDRILAIDDTTGTATEIRTVQIWVDPKYPDAHQDPKLREYLLKLGEKMIAAQIRYNSEDCLILMPPNMTIDKKWHLQSGTMHAPGVVDEIIDWFENGEKEVK